MPKRYDLILGALLIVIAVLTRVLGFLPPNFSIFGGLFLFAGFMGKRAPWLMSLPFISMFLADLELGFHQTMIWVYGSFVLTVWLGHHIANPHWKKVVFSSLASSFLFYLLTNFGVWFEGGLYPRTFQGLLDCYILAIPFFRNTLLSDLLFSVAFFQLYSVLSRGIEKVVSPAKT